MRSNKRLIRPPASVIPDNLLFVFCLSHAQLHFVSVWMELRVHDEFLCIFKAWHLASAWGPPTDLRAVTFKGCSDLEEKAIYMVYRVLLTILTFHLQDSSISVKNSFQTAQRRSSKIASANRNEKE